MTNIELIKNKVARFDYRDLGAAIADLRWLLEELKRLQDENARLVANRENTMKPN